MAERKEAGKKEGKQPMLRGGKIGAGKWY